MSDSTQTPLTPEELLERIEAETTEVTAEATPEPTCAKCGTFDEWDGANWCPVCGYYPAFHEKPEEVDYTLQQQEQVSEYDHWWQVVPKWAWIMIAGCVAIVAQSITVRLYYHYNGGMRSHWALPQALLGVALGLTGHLRAAFVGLNQDQKLSPGDIVMAPVATWNRIFRQLPKTRLTVWIAGWGITLTVTALTIIGGIRYSAVFDDWGFGDPVQPDVTIPMNLRPNSQDSGSDDDAPPLILPPEPKGPYAEAVIYGFFPNRYRGFDKLLLAAGHRGKPIQVAEIDYGQISRSIRKRLVVMMRERPNSKPVVDTSYNARWVEPSIVVKLAFNELTEDGILVEPEIKKFERDLRKQRGFAHLRKKGDYSVLFHRLDVRTAYVDFQTEHEKWAVACQRARTAHSKIYGAKNGAVDPEDNGKIGQDAKKTFEDVARELQK